MTQDGYTSGEDSNNGAIAASVAVAAGDDGGTGGLIGAFG